MKASPRKIRRPNDAHVSANEELVIPLPEPRLLRLIARSVLLFAVLLSLPWLRSALFSGEIPNIPANDDELFYIPKLLHDMKSHGFLRPEKRSLFVGNPGIHSALLRRNNVSCLPLRSIRRPQSLDFVFLVSASGIKDAYFRIVDSTMKVGGVAAFRLGTHPVKPFSLPANYRMIYIQNIGRTVVAVKKLYEEDSSARGGKRRRLLSAFRVDLVEFPAENFGDVGEWMRENVRKEEYVVVKGDVEAVEGIMEGEVIELVDELFLECWNDWENGELEEEGRWRKRAYWECLALFGKLRESGVAVHQWWG